jgi:hypothetical protein
MLYLFKNGLFALKHRQHFEKCNWGFLMDDTIKIRNIIWSTQILFKKGKIQNNRICTKSNGALKNENCMHTLYNLYEIYSLCYP